MMLGMAPCPPTMCLSSTLGLLNSNRYPNRRTGLLPEQLGDMCRLLWKDTSNCDNCMIIVNQDVLWLLSQLEVGEEHLGISWVLSNSHHVQRLSRTVI